MVKIIVGLMGSSAMSSSCSLGSPDNLRRLLSTLQAHGVNELDTARLYSEGKSEELLGQVTDVLEAGSFIISTKAPAFAPGRLAYDKIISNCEASLTALNSKSFDLYYLHGPDRETPLEESCRAMQDLHQQGKFSRWGVSNFHVDEVEEIFQICSRNEWSKPSVYQGGYNPITRAMERDLLPTLRKHGMTFDAYSPVGGGFFSKPLADLKSPPSGSRMDRMKIFHSMYINDVSLQLRQELDEVCEKEGVSVKEATFRWLVHHSALNETDGIVLGAASIEQMEENIKACEAGPLSQPMVDAFENMWVRYKAAGKAPTYCIPRSPSEAVHL